MDDRPLLDLALDAFVFAPIGIMVEISGRLPALAISGRERFQRDTNLYRMVGKMAVTQARKRMLSTAVSGEGATAPEPIVRPVPVTNAPISASTGVEALPIDGYDLLSAIQILPLLGRLSVGELGVVDRYERAHRSRTTVLGKLEQLIGTS